MNFGKWYFVHLVKVYNLDKWVNRGIREKQVQSAVN